MTLLLKKIKGKEYYYTHLSYFVADKSKSFSKYIGLKKPSEAKLAETDEKFRNEIMEKISGTLFSAENISKDDFIKAVLSLGSCTKSLLEKTHGKNSRNSLAGITSTSLNEELNMCQLSTCMSTLPSGRPLSLTW